jgi:hypothetical protein
MYVDGYAFLDLGGVGYRWGRRSLTFLSQTTLKTTKHRPQSVNNFGYVFGYV